MQEIHFYTDGSCLQNPDGPGGWAVVIDCSPNDKSCQTSCHHGNEARTTNNRMELTAVIKALEIWRSRCLEFGDVKLRIFTDSKYVCEGAKHWLPNWLKNNWRTVSGKNVKNKDLWLQLNDLLQLHKNVTFKWIKGHASNPYNETADAIARREAERAKWGK